MHVGVGSSYAMVSCLGGNRNCMPLDIFHEGGVDRSYRPLEIDVQRFHRID